MFLIRKIGHQLVTGSFISTFIASLSLLCLMEYANLYGPGPLISQMLSGYKDVVEFVISPFEPKIKELLENLAIWFTWFPKLKLMPHWKYIFVPLWIYVTRDGFICLQRNYLLGAVNFLLGATIITIASVVAGTEKLDDPLMLAAFWPIAGFTLFNVFTAVLDSTFRRPEGQTWIETFNFYFISFPLPSALIGCFLLYLGGIYKLDSVVILILFVMLIAVRNIIQSSLVAIKLLKKDKTKTWWEHFRPLQTKRVGLVLAKTIGYTFIIIAIDKGKELAPAVTAAAGQNVMIAIVVAATLMTVLLASMYWWRRLRTNR